jgi:hypothetical protein
MGVDNKQCVWNITKPERQQGTLKQATERHDNRHTYYLDSERNGGESCVSAFLGKQDNNPINHTNTYYTFFKPSIAYRRSYLKTLFILLQFKNTFLPTQSIFLLNSSLPSCYATGTKALLYKGKRKHT